MSECKQLINDIIAWCCKNERNYNEYCRASHTRNSYHGAAMQHLGGSLNYDVDRAWSKHREQEVATFPSHIKSLLNGLLSEYPIPNFINFVQPSLKDGQYSNGMVRLLTMLELNKNNLIYYFMENEDNIHNIVNYFYKRQLEKLLETHKKMALYAEYTDCYQSLVELLNKDAKSRPARVSYYSYTEFLEKIYDFLNQVYVYSPDGDKKLLYQFVECAYDSDNLCTSQYKPYDDKFRYDRLCGGLLNLIVKYIQDFAEQFECIKQCSEADFIFLRETFDIHLNSQSKKASAPNENLSHLKQQLASENNEKVKTNVAMRVNSAYQHSLPPDIAGTMSKIGFLNAPSNQLTLEQPDVPAKPVIPRAKQN